MPYPKLLTKTRDRPSGLTDATGPVFSGESGFRLDQPGFWKSLRGVESGWVDLSGPADPVLLSGRYSTSGGAGSAGGDISVTLRAFNRYGERQEWM